MNKNSTTFEQSKKLIKLGIDFDTADMMWIIDGVNKPYLAATDINENLHDTPAWSLSALLKLIPSDDKNDEYYVKIESHSDCHIARYVNCWDGCIHSEYSKESLLDAVFEMVVWLKENHEI